jgi:hypothetical protein
VDELGSREAERSLPSNRPDASSDGERLCVVTVCCVLCAVCQLCFARFSAATFAVCGPAFVKGHSTGGAQKEGERQCGWGVTWSMPHSEHSLNRKSGSASVRSLAPTRSLASGLVGGLGADRSVLEYHSELDARVRTARLPRTTITRLGTGTPPLVSVKVLDTLVVRVCRLFTR